MKALQQIIRRRGGKSIASLGSSDVRSDGRIDISETGRSPSASIQKGALWVFSVAAAWKRKLVVTDEIVIAGAAPVLLSFDTKRLYGCDGQLKILVEPLPAAEPNGNLITKIGRLLKDREVCRIRTYFEGDTLGSENYFLVIRYWPSGAVP